MRAMRAMPAPTYLQFPHAWDHQKPPRRLNVSELQHVIHVRRGEVVRVLPPGRHRFRPRIDQIWIEAATPQVLNVANQEVLTADGVSVKATVSSVTRVVDPLVTRAAGEWRGRFHVDMQLAMRALITQESLEDLVANRSSLDEPLLAAARSAAEPLGIEVSQVALRDLIVPGEQRRMLAEVVAARLSGQAALEKARAETAALRSLANAASMVRDNPAMYQLRLLQEMQASSGHTFVIGTDPPVS